MISSSLSLRQLRAVDILVIIFIHILSLISIIFLYTSQTSTLIIVVNLIVSSFIILLARAGRTSPSNFIGRIYDWYPVPMIFFIFKEVHAVIQSLIRNDWDDVLIGIDRIIFGGDPTTWFAKFSAPALTEILQIAYASYYFIMLAVGIELYLKNENQKFSFAIFVIVYGFVLSYFGYMAFPAVGPRFTLHNFYTINYDLPGLWLTNIIRDIINMGESISKGTSNAIVIAQRDVFPSGHTQMTIISMTLAHRYKLRTRKILYTFGILLIISTVYLRYHYVIDVLGGIVFVWLTLWSAPKLFRWWEAGRTIGETTGQAIL
jgi:membrane-associated phospholipid phosphatase